MQSTHTLAVYGTPAAVPAGLWSLYKLAGSRDSQCRFSVIKQGAGRTWQKGSACWLLGSVVCNSLLSSHPAGTRMGRNDHRASGQNYEVSVRGSSEMVVSKTQ